MLRKRDMRDPQKLGEVLRSVRMRYKRKKLSRIYDEHHVAMSAVPDYTGEGTTLLDEQVAKYKAEFPEGLPSVDDQDPGGS